MNTPFTIKTTVLILLITAFSLSLKAQDTTRKILVVRPGQTNSTPASVSTTPTTPVKKVIPAATPAPSITTPSTGSTTNSSFDAPVPSTYTGPAATTPGKTSAPVQRYTAPTTAERTGKPTYMDPAPVKRQTTTPSVSTPVPSSAGSIVPVAGGVPVPNGSAPVTTPKTAVVTPAAIITPVVVKIKKDTVYITRHDTIIVKPPRHKGNKIIFAEVGGPGLAISLNYDQRFSTEKDGLGYRIGFGYFGSGGNTVFTVPLQINYLYGSNGKYLELGGGTTFINSTGDNTGKTFIFDRVTGLIGTATIGVRYEPEKSLNFRLGFVPVFYDEGIIYAGGFSVGYTF